MNTNLPWDEITGDRPLKGTYKVTFLINISDEDNMTIDDLRQTLASSLAGDPVLEKTAKLDLEKTDENGNPMKLTPDFKVGDTVVIKQEVEITAKVASFHGHYVIGAKADSVEDAGEATVILHEGLTAKVNKIDGDAVELVDFETPLSAGLKNEITGEIEDIIVNIDSVIFPNSNIGLPREGED